MSDTEKKSDITLVDQDPSWLERRGFGTAMGYIEDAVAEGGINISFNEATVARDALYDAYALIREEVISARDTVDYLKEATNYAKEARYATLDDNVISDKEQNDLDRRLENIQSRYPELSQLYEIIPIDAAEIDNALDIAFHVRTRLDESESFTMRIRADYENANIAVNFYKEGDFKPMHVEQKLQHILDNFSKDAGLIHDLANDRINSHPHMVDAFDAALENANNALGGEEMSKAHLSIAVGPLMEEQFMQEYDTSTLAEAETTATEITVQSATL